MGDVKTPLYVGGLLVAAGILCNRWTLAFLLSPEGRFDSPWLTWTIALLQLAAIGAGLYLVLRRPRLPISGRDVTLLAFSTLLSLLLCEGALRIWLGYFGSEDQVLTYQLYTEVDPGSWQWSPHHYLNYYPTPGYRKGATFHNSLGYREDEFPVAKPEGSYRIVALGGSSTYTISVEDNDKTFTSQLEKILRGSYGHEGVEVINAGVGGYNSWESLINLEFRVLDLEPDLIIIHHGTNDVHSRLVRPAHYRGDNSGKRKQWNPPHIPWLVRRSFLVRVISKKLGLGFHRRIGLESFVDAATFEGASSVNESSEPMRLLEENPPVFFRRNLVNMVAIAQAHGIDVLLSTWAHSPRFGDYASTPHYQAGFKENNDVVRDVARERGVLLFDFAKTMPAEESYWWDGRHVNEEGALLKAELFAEAIDRAGLVSEGNSREPVSPRGR